MKTAERIKQLVQHFKEGKIDSTIFFIGMDVLIDELSNLPKQSEYYPDKVITGIDEFGGAMYSEHPQMEDAIPKEYKYTQEDMKNCFLAAREQKSSEVSGSETLYQKYVSFDEFLILYLSK